MMARSLAVLADQAGSARAAASIARVVSSAPRLGTVVISSPVAGSSTEKVLFEVTHLPLIRAALGNFLAIKFTATSSRSARSRPILRLSAKMQTCSSTASSDARIPEVSERGDDALEIAALGMFQPGENLLERRAEGAANNARTLKTVERIDPGGRERRRFDRFGIAFDRGARVDAVGDAMIYAGKHRSDHEIGIGVGAGDAMLDAGRAALPPRDPERHGAVVEAPMRRQRHVGLGHVAAVGVGGLGPDRHEVGHGLAHAAKRVTEERGDGIAGEEVRARAVEQAQMDVHARTRPVMVGLRHESGFELVRPRRGLDRTLQQEPVEGGGDGVSAMLQIDFQLPGTGLLHDGVNGETLDLANAVDVVDEGRERVHLLEAEGERLAGIAGDAFRRLNREAAIAVLARDVELKLDGGDRNLSQTGEALDLISEHRAGIEVVPVLDRHDHLRV